MTQAVAPDTGPRSLVLAGAGKMGGALLEAWLTLPQLSLTITVIDPHCPGSIQEMVTRQGGRLNPTGHDKSPCNVLVLAIKPQALDEAAPLLQPFVDASTLLISVIAGKTIADLKRAFPGAASVARAMPNTPAAISKAVTGVAVNADVTHVQRQAIESLLGAVGLVEWLDDERMIDVVTAVSGSGPAYVFYLVECLAMAATQNGLSADIAMRFARATIEGAGALLAARPDEPAGQLRRNVTSPGGTTAAALEVLMRENGGLPALMSEAVAAAADRARALGG